MESHPAWVRGLKLHESLVVITILLSHPAWVRGLKHFRKIRCILRFRSHPAWVRGLKLMNSPFLLSPYIVAPCVGAWIETHQ